MFKTGALFKYLGPESGNVIAEKSSSVIFQATGQLKWVKNNKASNTRQKCTEAPSSNMEILRKSAETLMKEEKEDSEEDVFGKYSQVPYNRGGWNSRGVGNFSMY